MWFVWLSAIFSWIFWSILVASIGAIIWRDERAFKLALRYKNRSREAWHTVNETTLEPGWFTKVWHKFADPPPMIKSHYTHGSRWLL